MDTNHNGDVDIITRISAASEILYSTILEHGRYPEGFANQHAGKVYFMEISATYAKL